MFLIILILIVFAYSLWRFGTRNFGYWKEKRVTHEDPMFFLGNMYRVITQKTSLGGQIKDWYNNYPEERYVGVHMNQNLGLVIRDPELIKCVLVADFQYFHERGFHPLKDVRDQLFNNLFTADGDKWKLPRQRLTPAFSSAKIKAMFHLIERTANKMLAVTKAGDHDVKELMARFTTDIIGSCGFGLDFDSLNDENTMFRRLGRRVVLFTPRDALVHFIKGLAPELLKHLNYFAAEIREPMFCIVKSILKQRNYEPSGRNDFIDLLLEVRQKGKIVGQSLEHFNDDGTPKTVEMEMDDELIVSQLFAFFAAGFETSSTASSFVLHELAFNSVVQERCHREIDQVLSRYDGKISYDAIKDMVYLHMVFKETLRLHSSPAFLVRRCVKKYTFPGSNLTIDPGVRILISVEGLHKDPKYFEDPEIFNPERFSPDNVENIPKFVYMPFGDGPRTCIGERLGILQSLAGVAALLSRYRVEPAGNSRRHPTPDPKSLFVENVVGGLPLTLVARDINVH